jgi:hypothetical protein
VGTTAKTVAWRNAGWQSHVLDVVGKEDALHPLVGRSVGPDLTCDASLISLINEQDYDG